MGEKKGENLKKVVTLLRNEHFVEYMPQKMKFSNHKEYNQFLEKRGNVFHFIDEAIENWYESSEKIPGDL
ncbi:MULTISPECIES: hypothetical protein [unclassified Wolbachia]|uniref:hypothetical protein n=1 Tax=unclassified Wolbachia TaxID=2640676 RepID=UPI003341EC6A